MKEAYALAAVRACMWEEEGWARDFARLALERLVIDRQEKVDRKLRKRGLEEVRRNPMEAWC